MFKNKYQGGSIFELFSGQGSNPVANWTLSGGPAAICKEYSKEVKGYVYCLKGSSPLVKMQLPQNPKQSLGLIQRFLVLQVNVPQGKDFSIELVISDREKQKKRLHFSTVYKRLSVNQFHAKIPLTGLKNNWSMLFIDLESLAGELFKGISALEAISLYASCQIRRIFTMKSVAVVDEGSMVDLVPCSYQFPPNVNYTTCVFNMKNLQCGKIDVQNQITRTKASSTAEPRHPSKEVICGPPKESLVSIHPWENNNSGPEAQFILREKVHVPHTRQTKPGQGQKEQTNVATGDDRVETQGGKRCEAILEEDFIGDDEASMYFMFQQPTAHGESTPASPESLYPPLDLEIKVQSGFPDLSREPPRSPSPPLQVPTSGPTKRGVRPPTYCLFPALSFSKANSRRGSRADSDGPFSPRLRQEVSLNDTHELMDSGESDRSYDSRSSKNLQMMRNLQLHEEDTEELQMLARLRELEEDEYGASSLSGPQIQQCNFSTGTDASPWTPVCMSPTDLEEIISLQSKPREWMDALGPAVTSPSQQKRSSNAWASQENRITDEEFEEEGDEEEETI